MQPTSFDHPNRRSIRLRGYDYTQAGAYFVTICTAGRRPMFGGIHDDRMILNDAGSIVEEVWNDLPRHFPIVELDAFVIMPNHVHGVIVLVGESDNTANAENARLHGLSDIIGAFKSYSAKRINILKDTAGSPVWQPRFYDHIIRGERNLHAIRDYIANNPLKWALDTDNETNWKGMSHGEKFHDYGRDAAPGSP